MNKINFVISKGSSIRDALKKIDKNKKGIVLVVDNEKLIGVASDGDIRRFLLKNSINNKIDRVINKKFVSANRNTSREDLLKKLDQRIKVIPVLSSQGKIIEIVTSENLPLTQERSVYFRSRSPVRVSFGGGGTDLTSFFEEYGGAVINATLSLYSHASLQIRKDKKVYIESLDLKKNITLKNLNYNLSDTKGFELILSVLRMIKPDFGFNLYLYSDYPMNSGLGGSAVVVSSIIGCFNQTRLDQWTNKEIAELSFQAERIHSNISGGWQDQYSTVTGGINFMEFRSKGNLIHPIKLKANVVRELEESLILCDTGMKHNSGNIHDDQNKNLSKESIIRQVQKNKILSYEMREDLLQGNLLNFADKMDKAWHLKRSFSERITNKKLDSIYSLAKEAGAIGGKLLGAGGGGFFLFFVPPEKKIKVMQSLIKKKLSIQPFIFDHDGLSSWRVRGS
jgi:D-glycero-alpha-D-manno-heptose-7-phosphate kinase